MESMKHFSFIVVMALGCVEFVENLPEIHHLRKRGLPPGKLKFSRKKKYF